MIVVVIYCEITCNRQSIEKWDNSQGFSLSS